METVQKYFAQYESEKKLDYEKQHIKRCLLSLKRQGIHTMYDLFREDKDTLLRIRGIGTKSVALVMDVCRHYGMPKG